MREFANRRVVVIGGSRGIGYAASRMLVARGARVAIGARSTAVLAKVRDELFDQGAMPYVGTCDIADTSSTGAFIDSAATRLGGIDALINCASHFTRADDDAAWLEALNVDLMGVVRAVRAAEPMLKQSGSGAIVTMSSVGSHTAHPHRRAYGAAKAAALEQYRRATARLYAADGIRVNCVVAGSTDFPGGIWDEIRQDNPAAYDATSRSIRWVASPSPRTLLRPLSSWRPSGLAGSLASASSSMVAKRRA